MQQSCKSRSGELTCNAWAIPPLAVPQHPERADLLVVLLQGLHLGVPRAEGGAAQIAVHVEIDGPEAGEAREDAGHAGGGPQVQRPDGGERALTGAEKLAQDRLHTVPAIVGHQPELGQVRHHGHEGQGLLDERRFVLCRCPGPGGNLPGRTNAADGEGSVII